MRAVWKYEIPITGGTHTRLLPVGASIVRVGESAVTPSGHVTFWAEVDDKETQEPRLFRVIGTGHEIRPNETYVGTVVFPGRALVWHLFEVTS